VNHFLRVMHVTGALVLTGVAALGAAGCRGETSAQPPVLPERNMYQQQRYNPQSRSQFFQDGRSMRKPVEHTVPQEMNIDPEISDGELADGSGYVLTIPSQVVAQLGGLESAAHRGEDRYNIYCRPCHDGAGIGQGTVVKRGMQPPPSLHEERIRHMPDGQLFATISRGVRNMPAYNYSIPTNDRWAIVSYVRALELSQAGE
jgi:mono/diheme cytochrome c family protein